MIYDEVWKPVVGWEGLYEVSNLGNVRSIEHEVVVHRRNTKPFSYIVPAKNKKVSRNNTGYLTVALSRNGKTENIQIHTLVATAFIDNPNNFRCVNHIDNNGHNNRVDNLEWCSHKGNNLHLVWNGNQKQCICVKCVDTGQVFPSMSECDRYFGLVLGTTSVFSKSKRVEPHTGYRFERLESNFVTAGNVPSKSIEYINRIRGSDANS